ncbi:phospholipase A2 [Streptomyces klenkii]|uniref:phospholipase A2 n=1 Tax=Streptomyces klenkii TaxID=1420899 RepID=UPI0033B0EB76
MPRRAARRRMALRLPALLALTTALLAGAPAAATATGPVTAPAAAESVLARADYLMARTYQQFAVHARQREAPFDWDTDGCSPPTPTEWAAVFRPACVMHDFGYHNYGNHGSTRLRLDPTEARRTAIDNRFLQEMHRICDDQPHALGNCRGAARTMYSAVRLYGGRAFH